MGKHEKVKSDFLVQYYLQELKLKSLIIVKIVRMVKYNYFSSVIGMDSEGITPQLVPLFSLDI